MTAIRAKAPPDRTNGRITLVIAGLLVGLVALAALAVGGALVVVHSTQRDDVGLDAGAGTTATSSGVATDVSVSAGVPGILWLAIGLLVLAGLLGAAAATTVHQGASRDPAW